MSNLPEKFMVSQDRIPHPFAQGVINSCVACGITKVLEVINYIKTGEYTEFSKGYTYGRHNRPEKSLGGMDYEYALNSLLVCGSVPDNLYPYYDEMPAIRDNLYAMENFHELEEIARESKIQGWKKIEGNIYKLENIKKCLVENEIPILGNMKGNTRHCVVIVGYEGEKLLYQDHEITGKVQKTKHNLINYAYYIDGGIGKMSELKKYNINEFENYINSLNVSRRISLIQLHHTYSPAYKQYTGNNHIALQTGMRNYHINTNGWSDIGQHFTIFPDGTVVTGRSMEMIPAGIKGGNTGAICIECLGNFDKGGDTMSQAQKNAIVAVIKILLNKFNLNASNAITYHCWWSSDGKFLGDYSKSKSVKTCPGTNFFGGNTKSAFEKNLLSLIENYGKELSEEEKKKAEIGEMIEIISNKGILSNKDLWIKKCCEDINIYWLCKKTANYLKN